MIITFLSKVCEADRDGKEITVFLVDSDDYTVIGDDLTPLGINNAVPGSGEIIE